MKIDLVKFLTVYRGIKVKDFDGIDGYCMDQYDLESLLDYAMTIQKDPSFLNVLLKDAITKGIWTEQQ